MLKLERLAFVLFIVPIVLLTGTSAVFIALISLFMLPIAALKYVFTGSTGIKWWVVYGPIQWIGIYNPLSLWGDRLRYLTEKEKIIALARLRRKTCS